MDARFGSVPVVPRARLAEKGHCSGARSTSSSSARFRTGPAGSLLTPSTAWVAVLPGRSPLAPDSSRWRTWCSAAPLRWRFRSQSPRLELLHPVVIRPYVVKHRRPARLGWVTRIADFQASVAIPTSCALIPGLRMSGAGVGTLGSLHKGIRMLRLVSWVWSQLSNRMRTGNAGSAYDARGKFAMLGGRFLVARRHQMPETTSIYFRDAAASFSKVPYLGIDFEDRPKPVWSGIGNRLGSARLRIRGHVNGIPPPASEVRALLDLRRITGPTACDRLDVPAARACLRSGPGSSPEAARSARSVVSWRLFWRWRVQASPSRGEVLRARTRAADRRHGGPAVRDLRVPHRFFTQ